jgi:hypothetical protein
MNKSFATFIEVLMGGFICYAGLLISVRIVPEWHYLFGYIYGFSYGGIYALYLRLTEDE